MQAKESRNSAFMPLPLSLDTPENTINNSNTEIQFGNKNLNPNAAINPQVLLTNFGSNVVNIKNATLTQLFSLLTQIGDGRQFAFCSQSRFFCLKEIFNLTGLRHLCQYRCNEAIKEFQSLS